MKNSIIKSKDRESITETNSMGGKGTLLLDKLAQDINKPEKLRTYAHAKLAPGSSVGYHEHTRESEFYYILKGNGIYNDNGIFCNVKKGDVTCTPSGHGHGIENDGNDDLEFLALIIAD